MTASLPAHDRLARCSATYAAPPATPSTRSSAGSPPGWPGTSAVPVVWVRAAFLVGGRARRHRGRCSTPACGWCCPPSRRSRSRHPGSRAPPAAGRRARPDPAARPTPARRSPWSRSASALVLTAEAIFGNGRGDLGRWCSRSSASALLWRQADEAQRARWLDQSERLNPVRAVFGAGGWAALRPRRRRRRPGGGSRWRSSRCATATSRDVYTVLVAAALGGIGLAITLGPWVWRLDRRPGRRARRAGPHPGAGRPRRPPPRLGAADAGADPEERRRRRRPSPAWPGPRSATCAPGSSTRRRPATAPSPARCARWCARSRTPTASTSSW